MTKTRAILNWALTACWHLGLLPDDRTFTTTLPRDQWPSHWIDADTKEEEEEEERA